MGDSTEDLRSLLRSADLTRDQTGNASIDKELGELVSLIGALDTDPRKRGDIAADNQETKSQYSFGSSFNERWKASDTEELAGEFNAPISSTDTDDFTVIRFGVELTLRGKFGSYLTACAEEVTVTQNTVGGGSADAKAVTYSLGVEGQGIGEMSDCLSFINLDNKEDTGPVRYGSHIGVKSTAAKERLLGFREGTKLGFWRHLAGQSERWVILKSSHSDVGLSAANTGAASSYGIASGHRRSGAEAAGSRGEYVRIGDVLMLQTSKSDHLLTVHEGMEKVEGKLVYKDRVALGAELWQLDQFGSLTAPVWYSTRPFLTGRFLAIPPPMRTVPAEIEARSFPGSVPTDGAEVAPPPTLRSFSSAQQQRILMRELLLVFSGVEGQYIRVASPVNKHSTAGGGSGGGAHGHRSSFMMEGNVEELLGGNGSIASRFESHRNAYAEYDPTSFAVPNVNEINLLLDLDSADRALAHQVSLLLPVCASAWRIREFIRYQSRYEFGLVSHALCAALRQAMSEFDLFIAQLEFLLNPRTKAQTPSGGVLVSGKGRGLTMQKLVFMLLPSQVMLRVLDGLCKRVRDLCGGRLLDELYVCMNEQGDEKARAILMNLLVQASEPFMKILSKWLYRGELHDPYKEFMVGEDHSVTREALVDDFNAQYWDNRYTLREHHVPRMMLSFAKRALTAGKYLNVLRDRDWNVHASAATEADVRVLLAQSDRPLFLSLELSGDNELAHAVNEAYAFSSRALLRQLQEECGLESHLKSLRRFFLLENGDFFTQFMDSAEEELRREVKDVSLSRIRGLLQLAVQTSTLVSDPHKEDLTCSLAAHNLIQHLYLIQTAGEAGVGAHAGGSNAADEACPGPPGQGLKGVEALTLDYNVAWPLSIVLSRRAVTKYQLLSRLLYFSKHTERRVLACWMDHQTTREYQPTRGALSASYCLRHRMLHFLQNFVYYITLEVIGPRGMELQESLDSAKDMDAVLKLHERFLDSCLKECLLASQELLKILTKLMTTCLLFADQTKQFFGDADAAAAAATASLQSGSSNNRDGSGSARTSTRRRATTVGKARRLEIILSDTAHESYVRMIAKFSEAFDSQLKDFLDKLWTDSFRHHEQLSNLCARLDYNGFYSSQYSM